MTDPTIIDYGARGEVRVLPDGSAIAASGAEALIAVVLEAVAERGRAYIALSGGSTPKAMAELLASTRYRDRVDWANVEIFWGDERWLPLDSQDSNAGEAKRLLLDQVPIPPEQIHPYDTATVPPEVSAARYEELIRQLLPAAEVIPAFDLVFLGLGDDGHTASLFPGTAAINERKKLVLSHFVPKLETVRVTMTPPLLNAARNVVFLASGDAKAAILADVLDGAERIDELPSQAIKPATRPVWLVDSAAAAQLARRPR